MSNGADAVKYDPQELAAAAADVDAGVNPVLSVPEPRDASFDPPAGVPNPNVSLYMPNTPLAAQPYRELAGEDVDAVARETARETDPNDPRQGGPVNPEQLPDVPGAAQIPGADGAEERPKRAARKAEKD